MKKRFYVVFLALMLSGCMLRQTVETPMSACPLSELENVVFSPETGRGEEEGRTVWDFESPPLYMTCFYKDGFERKQKLAGTFRSCRLDRGGEGGITAFFCSVAR